MFKLKNNSIYEILTIFIDTIKNESRFFFNSHKTCLCRCLDTQSQNIRRLKCLFSGRIKELEDSCNELKVKEDEYLKKITTLDGQIIELKKVFILPNCFEKQRFYILF